MPAEREQPLSGDQIAHALQSKALQASRLPDSHKARVHAEIDDLLTAWELERTLEVPC